MAVAGRSPAVVVVVPDDWSPAYRSPLHVVAGATGLSSDHDVDEAVLRRALDRADALHVALVVLHAWELPPLLSWSDADVREHRDHSERAVEELVERERSRRPDVPVAVRHVHGPADEAIAAAAVDAQLVVVGRQRPPGRPGGFPPGSTTRRLLRHAELPVMVVPLDVPHRSEPRPAQTYRDTWVPMP